MQITIILIDIQLRTVIIGTRDVRSSPEIRKHGKTYDWSAFMRYIINAWREHGESRLGIVSAETGVVLHLWRLSKITGSHFKPQRREMSRIKRPGTQQLARELFLVGCAEEFRLVQRARAGNMGDVCLNCGGCAEAIATVNMITQYTNSIKRGTA